MLRDEGLNVRSEQLLITGGCQQSIDLLCKAFLRPGDAVALENPAYPGALATFAAARVRTLAVAVDTDDAPNGRRRTEYRRVGNRVDAEPREIYFCHAGFSQSDWHGFADGRAAPFVGHGRALSGPGD